MWCGENWPKSLPKKEVSGIFNSLQSLIPSNCVCCLQPSHQSQRYDQDFNRFELWKVSVVSLKINTTEYCPLQWEPTGLWHWRLLFVCFFVGFDGLNRSTREDDVKNQNSNLCDLLLGFKFISWYWKKKSLLFQRAERNWSVFVLQ